MFTNPTRRTMLLTGSAAALGLLAAPTAGFAQSAPEPDGTVDMDALLAVPEGMLADQVKGSEDAPVTIVEYASMTCGHCRNFHINTLPELEERYINDGKVRMILREFPFDPRAAAGFMLARCAPNNAYFPMVDVLFRQFDNWVRVENARAPLQDIARMAGFTQESFEACLTDQALLDDVNAVRQRGADEFGVSATPTFFINGKRYAGALTIDQMSAIIDPLLG